MEQLTKFKGAMLSLAGMAGAGLLAKTAQGVVSLVQNLLPTETQKESGGRGEAKSPGPPASAVGSPRKRSPLWHPPLSESGCSMAPMEQAQESPYTQCPEVVDLVVTTEEDSDYELRHRFSVSFDLDFTGSDWTNARGNFSNRGGGYFVYETEPADPTGCADDWIELWLYITRGPNASVSA